MSYVYIIYSNYSFPHILLYYHVNVNTPLLSTSSIPELKFYYFVSHLVYPGLFLPPLDWNYPLETSMCVGGGQSSPFVMQLIVFKLLLGSMVKY